MSDPTFVDHSDLMPSPRAPEPEADPNGTEAAEERRVRTRPSQSEREQRECQRIRDAIEGLSVRGVLELRRMLRDDPPMRALLWPESAVRAIHIESAPMLGQADGQVGS